MPNYATGAFAQEMRELARSLFNDAEFGDVIRDGTVSRTTAGYYDPESQRADLATASTSCRVIWTGFTRQQLAQDLVRDAKLRFCKIGCVEVGFEVRPEDRLEVDGQVYDIVQVSDFSAGLGALYDATVR
jgi:hypothetical protein